MSPTVAGGLAGLGLAVGAWLLIAGLGARHATLDQRLAPYLRVRRTGSGLLGPVGRSPFGVLDRLLRPFLADASTVLARLSSPSDQVGARLVRAGRPESGVEQFRVGQLVGLAGGLAAGLLGALWLYAARGTSPAVLLVLVLAVGASGALVPDWLLGRQVRRRESRMLTELPAVAELLALAVAAGEGAVGALERVSSAAGGDLGAELRRTLAETRSGVPITAALDRLAARTGLVALSRFAEAIAVALTRGTPLAEVLRAQAQDVREVSRRELMETGGRKEVAMMIPVVFLILPVTIVFAVYPSLVVLRVGL